MNLKKTKAVIIIAILLTLVSLIAPAVLVKLSPETITESADGIAPVEHQSKVSLENDDSQNVVSEGEGSANSTIAIVLASIYLIYLGLSFFVLKPKVKEKALSQIGGKFEVSKDPMIWILPICLLVLYIII